MTHHNVYEQFKLYLPMYARTTETWFPNGKNSIRARQTGGQELIFTFNGNEDWRFETVKSFLKK